MIDTGVPALLFLLFSFSLIIGPIGLCGVWGRSDKNEKLKRVFVFWQTSYFKKK